MNLKTSKNKLVSQKKTALKTSTVKNIKIFKGNTNNIVIKNLLTNEIIGSKNKKGNGTGSSNSSRFSSGLKSKVNNGIDKLANERVLKTVDLDKEPDINLGANTIKSGYNNVVKVKRTGEVVIKTAKVIKNTPKNIKKIITNVREIPGKVREIPNKLRTTKNQIKKAAITSAKEISDIRTKISTGNFKGASKQAGEDLLKGSRKAYKTGKKSAKKVLKPTFKVTNIFGEIGLREFENNFKKSIKSKEDETADLGSNAVSNLVEGSKNSVIITAKATRSVRVSYRKVNTVTNKLKTYNNSKSKLKTANKVNEMNKNISKPAFKAASAARKQAIKLAEYASNVVKNVAMNIMRVIVSNPITLAIIALVLVTIIVLNVLLSVFMGVHGALTVDMGNNTEEWKNQMVEIDEATNERIHSGDRLEVINSNCDATWKDVLAVYYVKYGNMTLAHDGSISKGTGVNTVNPETWKNIYSELKSHLEENYVYGGNSPLIGFDCSGLVQYCFSVGGIELPRSTYEQCESGEDVTNQDWQPGDLVFFMGSDPQDGLPGHVGVYIGDNQYIQAPTTGDVIKISNVSDRSDLWGVRRVITAPDNSTSSSSGQNSSAGSNSSTLYQTINGTWADLFTKVGQQYGVDPVLLASIAMQESSLDQNAVSSAGACGLCQFMPDTFAGLGFDQSQIFDSYTNCCACAEYMKQLLNATGGDLTAALQCYNVGPGAYQSYGGDVRKMPAETQAYANQIYNWYKQFSNGGMPDGKISSGITTGNSVSSRLKKIYDLFNEVKIKIHKKSVTYILTRHDLNEIEAKLNMSKDDIDQTEAILEYDNFDAFGDNYNFKFKLAYD